MTSDRAPGRHPTDLELAAWVDEPGTGAVDISAHLEACALCRDKVAELATTRAALALDPPMPSEAAFAAQRERILAATLEAPRKGGGQIVRRIGWIVPLAAAAAVAAIVLVDRADQPAPGTAPTRVVAEAEAAAEEFAGLVVEDETLDAALAADDWRTPASIERSAAIEDEFALLTDAEQAAVLLELERTDFDL